MNCCKLLLCIAIMSNWLIWITPQNRKISFSEQESQPVILLQDNYHYDMAIAENNLLVWMVAFSIYSIFPRPITFRILLVCFSFLAVLMLKISDEWKIFSFWCNEVMLTNDNMRFNLLYLTLYFIQLLSITLHQSVCAQSWVSHFKCWPYTLICNVWETAHS